MAIAGILLAAGSATRMGKNKLLLELAGEPLVRRAARAALEAGLDPLLVVVGHEAGRVREALAGLGCTFVENGAWQGGQSTSLSAGAAAVPPGAEAAVVLLADMPLVDVAAIRAVADRFRETGAPLVSCRYGGVPAPPTLYAPSLLPELQGGEGEGRGREVVRRHRDRAAWVERPAATLADVDLPGDVEKARATAGDEAPDDPAILRQAAAWSEARLGVALATVTSTWGSALRPAGSQLAVNGKGAFVGSVSGGCVESAVVHEALAVIADGAPRRLRYGVTNERAWEVGLPCGGNIEVRVERVGGAGGLLPALLADLAAKRPVVLATDLATGVGSLLHPLDPGEGADPALLAPAREALARDRSALVETPGGETFLRVYQPPARILVVGAVHVAQALARMATLAGFEVVVIDPRPAYATDQRFRGVKVVGGWPDEAMAGLGLDPRTAVVTLAHDPKIDDPALVAALRSGAFYVGALGSRRSHAARRERLRALGLSDADLDRIHGPVGLAIGAVSPGEIAVSILAQVVERLRVR
jgi:xanthine dehydrogenase accessory factor